MKPTDLKRIALSGLLGLAAGAAGMAPSLLLLFPAAFGFLGVAWGRGCMSAGLAAACAVTGLVVGRTGGDAVRLIGTVALFLPPSLAIYYCLSNKRPYRSAVSASALMMGLALYVLTCVPPLLEGGGPFDYFVEYGAYLGERGVSYVQAMGAGAERLEYMERMAAAFKYLAPDVAATTITAMALAAGLADVLLARALCKGAGAELSPMAPFHMWQLSREFINGCMVLLIGGLLLTLSALPNASAMVAAIQVIVAGPYALMGVCLIAFSKRRRMRGNAFFLIVIAALVLLMPYSIYGLCFMGAVDRIFKMRLRTPPKP